MRINGLYTKTAVAILGIFVLTASAAQEKGMAQKKDPLGHKRTIPLSVAKQLIAAAEKVACRPTDCRAAFAVVDESGYLIASEKLDDTELDGSQLAIAKARTAAIYQRSTSEFRKSFDKGINYWMTFPDLNAANGGVPLVVDGKVIGAFGEAGNMSGPGRPTTDEITDAAVKEMARIMAQ